jgi:hypothetical protein
MTRDEAIDILIEAARELLALSRGIVEKNGKLTDQMIVEAIETVNEV